MIFSLYRTRTCPCCCQAVLRRAPHIPGSLCDPAASFWRRQLALIQQVGILLQSGLTVQRNTYTWHRSVVSLWLYNLRVWFWWDINFLLLIRLFTMRILTVGPHTKIKGCPTFGPDFCDRCPQVHQWAAWKIQARNNNSRYFAKWLEKTIISTATMYNIKKPEDYAKNILI
jgi:hypothetical protein